MDLEWRLLHDDPARPAPIAVEELEGDAGAQAARRLACAQCGHPITTTAARVAVDGQHEHEAANPHGYSFRFGCFATAPGCAPRGVPSRQHTWFRDHHWWVQDCACCGAHLGWLFFTDGGREFYGLILAALVEAGDHLPS
jgi:hypothetical protein